MRADRNTKTSGDRRAGLKRAGLFLLLVAFLAGGLSIRILKGTYDAPRMLGFRPSAEQPEPACVESQVVPPGVTLARLLDTQGVRPELANEFLPRLSALLDLRRIGPRDEVRLLSDRGGDLRRLEVHPGTPGEAGAVYIVNRDSTGFRAWREDEPLRRVYRKYEGSLSGSLTASLKRAGILAPQVRQFCTIFGEDVDAAGARAGDTWTMLTEEFVDPDGHLARPGRVVGGRFTSRGVAHEAFYFDPQEAGPAPVESAALVTHADDPALDAEAADSGALPEEGSAAQEAEDAPTNGGLRGFFQQLLSRDSVLPHEAEPPADRGADDEEAAAPSGPVAGALGPGGPAPTTPGAALPGEAPDPGVRGQATVRPDPARAQRRDGGYYRADGLSLRRAFLRAPLNYRRVSSDFTSRRLHPMFHVVRPHYGVDFAAAYGTPVKAVADGVVLSAGWMRGYGWLLRLRHRDGIVTYSAHLARFGPGIRAGATVRQGQVVGYVGTSGNSTGPHLDFRVEKNGKFVDPLRFRPSGGEPLGAGDRALFDRQVRAYREALAALDPGEAMPSERFAMLLSAGGAPEPHR